MDLISRENIKKHTVSSLAIIYANMITLDYPQPEVARINEIILTKYKPSGLLRIKDKAWRMIDKTYKTTLNP